MNRNFANENMQIKTRSYFSFMKLLQIFLNHSNLILAPVTL